MARKSKVTPEERRVARQQTLALLHSALGIDHPGPVPNDTPRIPSKSPDSVPVIVSIDLELWEGDNISLTEVGMSILDVNQVPADIVPGDRAQNLWPFLRNEHIRIESGVNLRNVKFVRGCPEHFDFGTSQILPSQEAKDFIVKTFHDLTNGTRPLYIVGHDVARDEELLSRYVGLEIGSITPQFKIIDGQDLWSLMFDSPNKRSVKATLQDLDIEFRNLHNAGNDAVYSMWTTLAMAVSLKEPNPLECRERPEIRLPADDPIVVTEDMYSPPTDW